jgi:hypothetical protein
MKRMLLGVLFTAVLAGADRPVVPRDLMAGVEKSFDVALRNLDVSEPYDLLGFTRGVYLPSYGAVLTTEVNLVTTMVSPFSPPLTSAQLSRLHQRKVERLAPVRELMRQQIVAAAATLDPVPGNEQIVYGITFFYLGFEAREGLPRQIIMQAPKQALLDYKANRISKAQLDSLIQVQEL